ncbi:hypothetical protein [Bradyrhizobium sp. Ash2021]|uniref:hypothetical protein n=1 Tax=Bradyrhizobium sp. Ash2021 TaxID=2954771 RepID=UPI002814E556|nr:hypothetical protein [Bradyrhizobium sp. Ash2021]WMT76060.1 hypothetical protein NL528_06650 [Bradyrhizobium sp. Ash2021]
MAFEAERGGIPLPLHRVIRTDFYIDEQQLLQSVDNDRPLRSLSAVWLKDTQSVGGFLGELQHVMLFDEVGQASPVRKSINAFACLGAIMQLQNRNPREVIDYIDSVRFSPRWTSVQESGVFPRPALATAILQSDIVIERSPPVAEKLLSLVHGATSTSLGVLLGTSFTNDPYVMILTIPAGILVMGTVLGISRGLERGLAKRVEKAVNPPTRRTKSK